MKPLISVIIPVFNVEKYIERCIESVLAQTYSNLEILLIDDGSEDSSGMICDNYAKKDSRIKVIHNENRGVSSTRNYGLKIYSGEYLMFIDSDDYIRNDAVEVMLRQLVNDGSDLVIGQLLKVYENGQEQKVKYNLSEDTVISGEKALSLLGSKNDLPCYAWAKLYKRSVFEGVTFPPLICAEDVWIFPTILERCKKISIASKIVYYYIQRSSSAVHSKNDIAKLDSIRAALNTAKFFFSRGMLVNAVSYYKSAVYQAIKVNNKNKARKLFYDYFSKSERKVLLSDDIGTRLRWALLYCPFLCKLLSKNREKG